MICISNKKKIPINNTSIYNEFASEIVEIFEEKLEELNITITTKSKETENKDSKIINELRKELVYKIEEFIYSNKNKLISKTA